MKLSDNDHCEYPRVHQTTELVKEDIFADHDQNSQDQSSEQEEELVPDQARITQFRPLVQSMEFGFKLFRF